LLWKVARNRGKGRMATYTGGEAGESRKGGKREITIPKHMKKVEKIGSRGRQRGGTMGEVSGLGPCKTCVGDRIRQK